ncbi:hypothetical protein H0E87_029814, partial [Populus deltoides]
MKKGSLNPNVKLKLSLPPPDEVSFAKFLTQSGTFKDGDLLVNRDGVRVVSQTESEPPPPITPSDNQLSLADMDMVKVIGKGSSGIVQLVQHKWTSQFFALKVIQMNIEEPARKAIAQELKINQSSQCPGEVKITDFGVSAIMQSTSGQANSFVGTYNYMSCATGQFPFSPPELDEGWTNVYELMEAIVDHPPPSASSDHFSPEFCSFISACVQKDPKDRQSAHELMAHPFMNLYEDLHVDLATYFTNAGSPLATLKTCEAMGGSQGVVSLVGGFDNKVCPVCNTLKPRKANGDTDASIDERDGFRNGVEKVKSVSDKHIDLLRPSARYYATSK